MKRILITGKDSYIGTHFKKYLEQYPNDYYVEELDVRDDTWKDFDFSKFDIVYHVAGLAHSTPDESQRELYYKVNTDLTYEVAKKAKESGINQFIFMSSIIVYGSGTIGEDRIITRDTPLTPDNFYGDSKKQAEIKIQPLEDENFKVVIIRPPMIYGPGSKGNYPLLSRFAKKTPIFPTLGNQRSMLYLGNLMEFVKQMVDNEESGIFLPQNDDYVSSKELVKAIAEIHNHYILFIGLFNPILKLFNKQTYINKVFGNLTIDKELSEYKNTYCRYSFLDSVKETEKECKKKILILVNHDIVIYNFRKELVDRLLQEGYEVYISSPYGDRIDYFIKQGCIFKNIEIDRHGLNPIRDLKIIKQYRRLIKEIEPYVILTYTIKPNIYGAIAAKQSSTPVIANITGLGTAVENGGILQMITVLMYKYAFSKIQTVFFQNEENMNFFSKKNIAIKKHKLLPGSGVNLQYFEPLEYPKTETIEFVFISRIMKEKGIEQYLDAAKYIRKKYTNTRFHICGFCEQDYENKLKELGEQGIIIYHGLIDDIREILKITHCTIHPTYYPEGMSNVLLESCSCARPIITTNRSGCREIVDDSINGYIMEQKDSKDLINKIEKFLLLSFEEKKNMGINGRKKMEKIFDRNIVVEEYINLIHKILGG